jgi:hypothetical protein
LRSRWKEGTARPSASAAQSARSKRTGSPVGTTFSVTLNQAGKLALVFTQPVIGRKRKHGTVTRGTLTFGVQAGTTKVSFQGRLPSGKRLPLGAYTLVITATNSAGARSAPQKLRFTIVS